jgi:hypothetical protein
MVILGLKMEEQLVIRVVSFLHRRLLCIFVLTLVHTKLCLHVL